MNQFIDIAQDGFRNLLIEAGGTRWYTQKLMAELGTLRIREEKGEPTRCFDWGI
jgi:hypothetical protein